jgi:Ni/Co efflux regulator RcnB
MEPLIVALIAASLAAVYFAARAHSAERETQELWSLCNRLLFDAAKERERQARREENGNAGT